MIEHVMNLLKHYLKDEIHEYRVLITPNSFKISSIIFYDVEYNNRALEEEIRHIIGYSRYFEYYVIFGAFLWEKFPSHKNPVEFRAVKMGNNIAIKKAGINLNRDSGVLKKVLSNHDKIKVDGYILNPNELIPLNSRYKTLMKDNVRFISSNKSSLFFDADKLNYHQYKEGNDSFNWIVLPNEVINTL